MMNPQLVALSDAELAQVAGGDDDSYHGGEIVEGADGGLWMCIEDADGSMYFEPVNDF